MQEASGQRGMMGRKRVIYLGTQLATLLPFSRIEHPSLLYRPGSPLRESEDAVLEAEVSSECD